MLFCSEIQWLIIWWLRLAEHNIRTGNIVPTYTVSNAVLFQLYKPVNVRFF